MASTRSIHDVQIDGENVQLRVFVPAKTADKPKPAVVMVCGLLWLGGGILGQIGIAFNDRFGYSFADNGTPCVQIHSPSRHIGHTRMMDAIVTLLWPLGWLPVLREVLIVVDAALLATDLLDAAPLLLLPFAHNLGLFSLLAAHLLIRGLQWLRGNFPGPAPRDHQKQIDATVTWAKEHQELLGSNGKLVLCGYSSGGHCASLYAASPEAPRFEAVVLISGIYGLRTHAWTGAKRLLVPVFDLLFKDILGVDSDEERTRQSPEVAVQRQLQGQKWYILTAWRELMGLPVVEDILFGNETLRQSLEAKGAEVHRVQCGLNHWLLVLSFSEFARSFCAGL